MAKLSLTTILWEDGNDHLFNHFTRVTLPSGDEVVAIDESSLINGGGETYLSVAQDLGWSDEDDFSLAQWCSMFPSLSFIDLGYGGVHVRDTSFSRIVGLLDPTLIYAHTHAGLMFFDPSSGALDNGEITYIVAFTAGGYGLTSLEEGDEVAIVLESDSIFDFTTKLSTRFRIPTCLLDGVVRYLSTQGGK